MSINAINAKNPFRGKISAITVGSVVSEVDVQTPNGIVTCSVRDPGLEVPTLIKATDVSSAKL